MPNAWAQTRLESPYPEEPMMRLRQPTVRANGTRSKNSEAPRPGTPVPRRGYGAAVDAVTPGDVRNLPRREAQGHGNA